MSNRRLTRLSGLMQSELSRMLTRARLLEDVVVTITSVDITPDLRQAFVYVSTLSVEIAPDNLLASLAKLAPDWQHELAQRLHIKYTPRLYFRYDDSLTRGDRVMDILRDLEEGTPPEREAGEEAGEKS
jgi:ribosome-binding factor A